MVIALVISVPFFMKQLLGQASHAYTPEAADAGRPLRAADILC